MALIKVKKIQLITLAEHKDKILEVLQKADTMEITETEEELENKMNFQDLQKIELIHANLDFAIKTLTPYATKKKLLSQPAVFSFREVEEKVRESDYQKIIDLCLNLEENIVTAKNNLSAAENEIQILGPWKKLKIDLENLKGSETTSVITGSIKSTGTEDLMQKLHKLSTCISTELVEKNPVDTYILIIFDKTLEKDLHQILTEYKFIEADLPESKGTIQKYLQALEEKTEQQNKIIEKAKLELKASAKHLDDLKIASDYFGWQLEKLETEKKLGATEHSIVLQGWIPVENLTILEEKLEKETREFSITELRLKKDEVPPVIIKNNNFISPFESVSKIYGLPKYDELDPTPFLAAYFILFFALCLTDAGYGLLMFIGMGLVLRFFKLAAGIRKLVKLLMYGGIVTVVIGALFGGWFGLTPDQVPESLTYINANGEKMFLLQKVNAINSPIAVLTLALTLGYLQILTGVIIKFIHSFKQGPKVSALMDSGTWILMLTGIGVFIASSAFSLNPLGIIAKWWVILAAVILILTQGRDKSSIMGKFISGILSLYGLIGYMSDILSYSRLLALGLATSIIGLAVNIIADLVGGLPYIGWLIMIVVFIGGHIFNLVINALGAFIHSGRLQFVEFFTKFMEGGGDDFRPFSKKTKYIFIKNNS